MKSSLLFIAGASAQEYCRTNQHSVDVDSLPYKTGDLHQCQYAGTVKTKSDSNDAHNLFYWYFKHPDPDAPLLLWLNGGPGATSMFGLFLENGQRISRELVQSSNKSQIHSLNGIFHVPVHQTLAFVRRVRRCRERLLAKVLELSIGK